MLLQFRLKPSRSNGDIGPGFDRPKELARFFNRRSQIRIAEEKYFPGSIEHSVAHAKTLPAISGVLEQPEHRIRARVPAHEFGRVIARSVVDHDHFGVPVLGAE